MATRSKAAPEVPEPARTMSGRGASILILDAPYYPKIGDALLAGAVAEIEERGARWERITVAGALELPLALKQAVAAGLIPRSASHARWCGAVVLGCVIRGETSHYETVCTESNRWIMDTAVRHNIPLGNGILTVETEAHAKARAKGRDGKGAQAAAACFGLIETLRVFQERGA